MTEREQDPVDIAQLFEEGTVIDEALRVAAQDARRRHKALDQPIAEWRDGKVVWTEARDIVVYDANGSREADEPE